MLSEVRQLYRWAIKRQPWRRLLAEGNPAELVEKEHVVDLDYADGIRDRVLSDAEIRELHKIQVRLRLRYEGIPVGHRCEGARPMKRESELSLWIMLATLCRVGETLKTEWKDVDLESAECFIPGPNTKRKSP